jgi:hypothetical protein
LHEFVLAFKLKRSADPFDISALIVVPKWRSYSSFKHILNKYKVVHTYPKGTFPFSPRYVNNREFVPQGQRPFDVTIYLANHTIEERSTIARASIANYAHAHGIEAKTNKSHQPRVEYANVNLTSQQIDNGLLKFRLI